MNLLEAFGVLIKPTGLEMEQAVMTSAVFNLSDMSAYSSLVTLAILFVQ